MRDSLMRDRVADKESIDGSVDKSVVNWLMHVISGKDPIGLGINDASAEVTETAEPRPQVVSSRNDAPGKKAEPSLDMTITAEDLCGAPIFPVIGTIQPAKDEITADDLCFVPKEAEPEPFRRMTGPQLVELSKSAEMAAAESAVADVFREGVYYGPPASETTTAIAESLRPRKQQPAEAKTAEIDPVEIARDPEYIEEKLRAGNVTVDEVDWIPSKPIPAVPVSSEPESAAVVTVADPFGAVEEKAAEPEVVEAEPVAVIAEPEVVEAEPVAVIAEPEVVEAEPVAVVVEAAPEVAAVETVVDPFAGVFEMPAEPEVKAAEPVAVVAEPEVVEAAVVEPEVTAEPEAVQAVYVQPEVVTEPEAVQAAPEMVVAEPEVAEPEVAEPEAAAAEVIAEPAVAEPVESEVEAVAESTAVAEPVVEDEAVAEPAIAAEEVPAVPEMVAEAVATQEPEAEVEPTVSQPVAVNGFTDHMWTAEAAQRDQNEKKFSAEDYYQEQRQMSPPAKVEMAAEKAAEPLKETAEQPENLTAALKTLMQLGSVLPLAARMAPMFEGNGSGEPATGSSQEVRQEVSGLRLLQYEIKTTVQDHSTQLKRLEEHLSQVRESFELDSSENANVMENVKSTVKLVRVMGIGLGVMLMVLILMIGMMLVHGK
jgi:hypothetical protein